MSIHLGEDKTKSILLAILNIAIFLNIKYKDINIKQHLEITYLKCVLDEMMSGELIALKVINNINSKLKFLYRKNRFLSQELWRKFCNAMWFLSHILIMHIQPSTLISLKKTKKKIQVIQNKCIRFCLRLDKMLIYEEDFDQ